jgi:lipid-binding SYLF domain-containing protein
MSNLAMAADAEETRDKVRAQSSQVLERLYAVQPDARDTIASAKGYATFSRWGLTLGAIGGSFGRGLLVALPSRQETFMRFVEGSAGVGFGIKKYDLIFVFQEEEAMARFATQGWQAGGQATAAAMSREGGQTIEGAFSVSPGILVYQVTERGLAAELGIKGTKYYQDKALNQ